LARRDRGGIDHLPVLLEPADGRVHPIKRRCKTLAAAVADIFTPVNFAIGVTSALIGYVVVEFLRRRL
jgi:hypothetical protein